MASGSEDLVGTIRDLSFCHSLDAVVAIVRVAARRLSAADGVSFVLRDGDQCHYAEENAIAPLWKGRRFPLSSCISGWVMLNRQAVAIPDIYSDPRIPHDAYRPTFVHSLVMVPVRADDPLAAIGAYWAAEHAATDAELARLQALADATALALENVKLYEGMQAALERERLARRQAEEATRAKDEWISILSHELRTPLTPILGWVRMLRSAEVDPGRTRHALEVIERNALAEARIVDDLLDLSNLESGHLRLEMHPVDLRDLVAAAVDAIRSAAETKALRVRFSQPPGECTVLADAARLQQAIWNLLTNAVKFTPPGGAITVSLERQGAELELRVEDTGEGLSAEVLPRLFTRFERGDTSSTRASGGLGLGLTLVRKLTELHGGTVHAESDGPGRGSVFSIRLPHRQAAAREGRASAPPPDGGGLLAGLTVLVVDDDRDTLDLLSFALEGYGARVVTAASARDGLEHVAEAPPDVLISDLAMPGEDGYSLMKRVRAMQGLQALPAVALSAYARNDDARRALESGYSLHLAKPIEPWILAEHVHRLANGRGERAAASSL